MNLAPILPTARPLFRDVRHSQIQHLKQAVIRGEHGLGFRDLSKLTVESLNRICGVNQPPELLRELEIGTEIRPVGPPGLRNLGVLLIPMLRKNVQSVQRSGLVYCTIDGL